MEVIHRPTHGRTHEVIDSASHISCTEMHFATWGRMMTSMRCCDFVTLLPTVVMFACFHSSLREHILQMTSSPWVSNRAMIKYHSVFGESLLEGAVDLWGVWKLPSKGYYAEPCLNQLSCFTQLQVAKSEVFVMTGDQWRITMVCTTQNWNGSHLNYIGPKNGGSNPQYMKQIRC